MKKIKIIKAISLSILFIVFFFLFLSSFFLIKNTHFQPLKFAFFNFFSTLCSLKCLGKEISIPFFFETLKLLAIFLFISSLSFATFKIFKKVFRTMEFVKEIKKEAKHVLKFGIKTNIFDHEFPLAFTAGFFKPEIFLSSSLVKTLEENELKSIILHEDQHRKSLDPLKNLIVSFVSDFLFFFPIIQFFKNLYLFSTEIIADMSCISRGMKKEELALAFLKVCKIRNTENSWFFNKPLERIKFIFERKIEFVPSLKKIILSFILLLLIMGLFFTPQDKERFNQFLNHHNTCTYHNEND